MINILLADDHEIFRSGLRAALETQSDLNCVGEVGDGLEAVRLARQLSPDVAMLDVRMPRMDGLEAAEEILRSVPSTKVLLLTTYDEDDTIYRALKAGTSGFLLKSSRAEELMHAVRVVARGDALIDPSVTRRLIGRFAEGLTVRKPPAEVGSLTNREGQVLVAMGRGLSNSEIAATLHLGEQTVKTHVSRVLAKLGLRDRVQAVVYAHENHLLTRGDGSSS